MGFGKGDHRLIVLFTRTKLLGELGGRQKMAVIRTGRIVELFEQLGQRRSIAQRQLNSQLQMPRTGQLSDGLQVGGGRRQTNLNHLLSCRPDRPGKLEKYSD